MDGVVFVKYIIVFIQRLPEPYVLEFVETVLSPPFARRYVLLHEKNKNKNNGSSRKPDPSPFPPFPPPFFPPFPSPFPSPLSVFYSIETLRHPLGQRVFRQIERVETRSRPGFGLCW